MEIKAEFYRWSDHPVPDWVTNALADNTIVTDGDGDAFLVSESGRMRINLGDYLMQSMTAIFLVEERVYDAMTASKRPVIVADLTRDEPAVDDGAAEFAPPFSPTILARSARAREMQAEWAEAQGRVDLHPGHPTMQADIENARVEGADVPDEPEETTDATPVRTEG